MITLTDKGAEKVREFLSAQNEVAETAGLRVGVRGGGCSGFQYALAFDEQRDGDTVFEDQGIRLIVDTPSIPYVKGSVVQPPAGRPFIDRTEMRRGMITHGDRVWVAFTTHGFRWGGDWTSLKDYQHFEVAS